MINETEFKKLLEEYISIYNTVESFMRDKKDLYKESPLMKEYLEDHLEKRYNSFIEILGIKFSEKEGE